jgi:hypothetical protein
MNFTDELERLSKLHKEGALTDDEFAEAKAKLLSPAAEPSEWREPTPSEPNTLGEAANRYVTLQTVMAVIGVIIFLIFLFGVILPHTSSGPNFSVPGR